MLADQNTSVPYTFMSGAADMARAYALIGKKADAARILNKVWADAKSYGPGQAHPAQRRGCRVLRQG